MPETLAFTQWHPELPRYWVERLALRYPRAADGRQILCDRGKAVPSAVTLCDLSLEAVSLRLDHPVAAGTLLRLELQTCHRKRLRKMLSVVHARRDPHGGWSHRCLFMNPLRPQELQELAGGHPAGGLLLPGGWALAGVSCTEL